MAMLNGTFKSIAPLISDEERQIYEIVTLVVISSAIGLFGLGANIINIIVFVRQGLNNSVNIGFMGLAISDLLSLVTIEWYCISFNPLFINSDINFFPPDVQHLSGGHPHGCFARITAWVTAYITFERCLCITFPLKVKQILTPRRTLIILIAIYFIVMLPMLPEYATAYIGLKYFPFLNKTLYGLVFTSERYKVDGLSFLLFAILMFVSFVAVIVCTAVLVVKLNQKSQWRQKSTFDSAQSEIMSRRDRSTMKTVILIASVLIINYSPTVVFFTGVFIVPEFNITGQHRNLFLVSAAFCFIFDTLNSSVTIISYYTMSSKFRQTFHELFSLCLRKKGHSELKTEIEKDHADSNTKL
ncbi:FMRFamide receptor [Biomphalaria glabrata]|nr:FMRFamide receptor [Biomphalaria glabrata]